MVAAEREVAQLLREREGKPALPGELVRGLEGLLEHRIGDRIDETLASYFLEAMPPACWKQGLRQMGEPYSYDEKGRTTYLTIKHQSGAWLYDGPRVLGG